MTSSVNGESKPDLQEENMKPTQQLHNLGQSLWLDNITRALLTRGTLRRYIDDLSVTGLTSNPSIFDVAIKDSNLYDDAILQKTKEGKSGEALFFELAIDDLRQAADELRCHARHEPDVSLVLADVVYTNGALLRHGGADDALTDS